MKINLSQFDNQDVVPVEGEMDFKIYPYYHTYDDKIEMKFNGEITRIGSIYNFVGSGEAKIKFKCDKCLEKADKIIRYPIEEDFSEESQGFSDENEIWPIENKEIELYIPLKMNMYNNLPMQTLCKDDCKGLCLKCGQNLNKEDCGCDRFVMDPRLAALRSLLDDEEV